MACEVEVTDEFSGWFSGDLSQPERERVTAAIDLLQAGGPGLGRPRVDTVKGSRWQHMKELRVGTLRVLFAFDPRRAAIVLIGGDKRDRWTTFYDEMVPRADDLYDEHLLTLRDEGLIE